MIVLNILGYFGRNKQNSYAALIKHLLYMMGFFYFEINVHHNIFSAFLKTDVNILLYCLY